MMFSKEYRDRLARIIELQQTGRMKSYLLPGYDRERTAIDLQFNLTRLASIDRYRLSVMLSPR